VNTDIGTLNPRRPLAGSRVDFVALSESNGGVEGSVPHDHHIPVVPELVRDLVPQQERLARGEDRLLAPRRLFSRVWRWDVCGTPLTTVTYSIYYLRDAVELHW